MTSISEIKNSFEHDKWEFFCVDPVSWEEKSYPAEITASSDSITVRVNEFCRGLVFVLNLDSDRLKGDYTLTPVSEGFEQKEGKIDFLLTSEQLVGHPSHSHAIIDWVLRKKS